MRLFPNHTESELIDLLIDLTGREEAKAPQGSTRNGQVLARNYS